MSFTLYRIAHLKELGQLYKQGVYKALPFEQKGMGLCLRSQIRQVALRFKGEDEERLVLMAMNDNLLRPHLWFDGYGGYHLTRDLKHDEIKWKTPLFVVERKVAIVLPPNWD